MLDWKKYGGDRPCVCARVAPAHARCARTVARAPPQPHTYDLNERFGIFIIFNLFEADFGTTQRISKPVNVFRTPSFQYQSTRFSLDNIIFIVYL